MSDHRVTSHDRSATSKTSNIVVPSSPLMAAKDVLEGHVKAMSDRGEEVTTPVMTTGRKFMASKVTSSSPLITAGVRRSKSPKMSPSPPAMKQQHQQSTKSAMGLQSKQSAGQLSNRDDEDDLRPLVVDTSSPGPRMSKPSGGGNLESAVARMTAASKQSISTSAQVVGTSSSTNNVSSKLSSSTSSGFKLGGVNSSTPANKISTNNNNNISSSCSSSSSSSEMSKHVVSGHCMAVKKPVGIAVARQRTPGSNGSGMSNLNLISPPNIRESVESSSSACSSQSNAHLAPRVMNLSGAKTCQLKVSPPSCLLSPATSCSSSSPSSSSRSPIGHAASCGQQSSSSTFVPSTSSLSQPVSKSSSSLEQSNHVPAAAAANPPSKVSSSFFRPWELDSPPPKPVIVPSVAIPSTPVLVPPPPQIVVTPGTPDHRRKSSSSSSCSSSPHVPPKSSHLKKKEPSRTKNDQPTDLSIKNNVKSSSASSSCWDVISIPGSSTPLVIPAAGSKMCHAATSSAATTTASSVVISRDRAQLALNAMQAMVSPGQQPLPTLTLKKVVEEDKSSSSGTKKSSPKKTSSGLIRESKNKKIQKPEDLNNNKKKIKKKSEVSPEPVKLNPESLMTFIGSRGYQQLLLHLDDEHGNNQTSEQSVSNNQKKSDQEGEQEEDDESKLPAKKRKRSRSTNYSDTDPEDGLVPLDQPPPPPTTTTTTRPESGLKLRLSFPSLTPTSSTSNHDPYNFESQDDEQPPSSLMSVKCESIKTSPPIRMTLSCIKRPKKVKKSKKEEPEEGKRRDKHKRHRRHSSGGQSDKKAKKRKLKEETTNKTSSRDHDSGSETDNEDDEEQEEVRSRPSKKSKKSKFSSPIFAVKQEPKEKQQEVKQEVKKEEEEEGKIQEDANISHEDQEERKKTPKSRKSFDQSNFEVIRRSERIFIHDSIICSIPLSATTDAAAMASSPDKVTTPTLTIKKRRTSTASTGSGHRGAKAKKRDEPRRPSVDTLATEPEIAQILTPPPDQLEVLDEDLSGLEGSTDGLLRIVLKNPEDGHLYTASVRQCPSREADKFEVTLDGSRTRTLVLDREHLKRNSVKEMVPRSLQDFVTFSFDAPKSDPESKSPKKGASPTKSRSCRDASGLEGIKFCVRVCAFWSGQVRVLYTGTVAITQHHLDVLEKQLQADDDDDENEETEDEDKEEESLPFVDSRKEVLIEFDDGDFARIPLSDVRILTRDFLAKNEVNMNSQSKRRRGSAKRSKKEELKEETPQASALILPVWKCDESSILKKGGAAKREYFTRITRTRISDQKGSKPKVEVLKVGDAAIFFQEHQRLTPMVISSSSSSASSSRRSSLSSQSSVDGPNPANVSSGDNYYPTELVTVSSPSKVSSVSCINSNKMRSKKVTDEGQDCDTLPFVGRIDSFWRPKRDKNNKSPIDTLTGMKVKVRWFYHASEAGLENTLCVWSSRALFESLTHTDVNDVQSIRKKCHLLPFTQFVDQMNQVRKRCKPTGTSTTNKSSESGSTSTSDTSSGTTTSGSSSTTTNNNECSNISPIRTSRRGVANKATKMSRNWYYLAGTFEPLTRQVKYDPSVPLI